MNRFGSKVIDVNGKTVNLQIWDTAGQEAFRSIARSYYRGSTAALLVYDVTRRETFTNLSIWLQDAREFASEEIVFILVGNKIDLDDKREVTTDEGEKFAEENNLMFIETSAMTAENVEKAFITTAREIINKIQSHIIDPKNFPGIKMSQQEGRNYQSSGSSQQQRMPPGSASVISLNEPSQSSSSEGGCC